MSRPPYAGAEIGETRFGAYPDYPLPTTSSRLVCLQAEPLTGRTHQIRVHAAESGFPILGDTLYGGTPAARVCLHAAELALRHPATGEALVFRAPVNFDADVRRGLRSALIDPRTTNAWRAIHGAGNDRPGVVCRSPWGLPPVAGETAA